MQPSKLPPLGSVPIEKKVVEPPEWFDPKAPKLTKEELNTASKDLLLRYRRRVTKNRDPPISNQVFGGIAFNLFREPRHLKNGQPVYGFFKLRGNFGDIESVEKQGAKIIRSVDSKFKTRIAEVGAWLPVCDDDAFSESTCEVNENEAEDLITREKEAEARRIRREIREREDEVKKGDTYDDPNSLRFYTMRRVTELRLNEELTRSENNIKVLKEKITEVRIQLKKLELKCPQYKDQWIEENNKERRQGGLPDYVPGKTTFMAYEAFEHPDITKPDPEEPKVEALSSEEQLKTKIAGLQTQIDLTKNLVVTAKTEAEKTRFTTLLRNLLEDLKRMEKPNEPKV
jgi:uncharacterized protein DUF5832